MRRKTSSDLLKLKFNDCQVVVINKESLLKPDNSGYRYKVEYSYIGNYNYSLVLKIYDDDVIRDKFTENPPKLPDESILKLKPSSVKEITKDTLVYFDPECTVPRNMYGSSFKKTNSLEKADIVVIPNGHTINMFSNCLLFVDDVNKTCIVVENWDVNEKPVNGEVFQEFYSRVRNPQSKLHLCIFDYDKFKNGKLIHSGNIYGYYPFNAHLAKVIVGTYTKYVHENELQLKIGDTDKDFTHEKMDSLMALLSSEDPDSRLYGMMTLAQLNFQLYPACTRYLLSKTWNVRCDDNCTSSQVKYMLKYVNHFHKPYIEIGEKEHAIIKPIIEQEMKDLINKFITDQSKYIGTDVKTDFSLELPDL